MSRFFSRESRIDRAYNRDRNRFGLTDAERREQGRQAFVRKALVQLVLALVLALYVIGKLNA